MPFWELQRAIKEKEGKGMEMEKKNEEICMEVDCNCVSVEMCTLLLCNWLAKLSSFRTLEQKCTT